MKQNIFQRNLTEQSLKPLEMVFFLLFLTVPSTGKNEVFLKIERIIFYWNCKMPQ